ncbi:MAG TPA: hypothetical protein VIV11_16330 [Kofleriaceae bacterium]
MTRRWSCIGVLGGLAVGACVSIPTFKGGDAGTDSDGDGGGSCMPDLTTGPGTVTFESANGGGLVTASTYTMHFAASPEFHFPDDIRIGGVDIMTARAQNCAQEDLAGMALYPGPAIRPGGMAPVAASDLIVKPGWGGPAVVKLVTHWGTLFAACGAMPNGDSMFSLFPEGRVVRHDYMHNDTSLDWNTCACNSGVNYYPTSYWTFERASFTTVQVGPNTPEDVSTFTGPEIGSAYACLQGSGAVSVATAWEPMIPADQTTRVLGPNPMTIAFVFDWVRMHQNTTAGPFDYTTTSALFLGGGCSVGIPRAQDFINPAQLTINGFPEDPGIADGIYGGTDDMSNTGGIPLTSMTAELAGAAPVGFTVWLKFPAPACDITITKNPPPGNQFYTKQQIDDDEWVVWFRDPLTPPHTITVTAK